MRLLNPLERRCNVPWPYHDGASHSMMLLESFRCRSMVRGSCRTMVCQHRDNDAEIYYDVARWFVHL